MNTKENLLYLNERSQLFPTLLANLLRNENSRISIANRKIRSRNEQKIETITQNFY